jgi:GTPase-associated protein 1, N-terminal domain type 2/GTPase-associated protein 1, middle domain
VADGQGRDGEVGEDGEDVMTDAGFGRLLYTDCAPGTGRGGGGGFQVQAQSPRVDREGSALATGWLLYEVQNAWVAERRPVEEFPPGFAHVAGPGYGTGQSRYVGKEVMGGRQGNHLADCIVTHDAELYGTIRPAQLYGAKFWQKAPWPTTDCPDYDEDLETGPLLTLDALTGWARERPGRGSALAGLLSVLEDAEGPRAVIVSADPDEAMRWLAAATVLLPQRRAVDVTFKVFSANPLRAQQRMVAAPPDLNPRLRPGLVPGVFILDATTCQADQTPVSERAAFLAGKLADDQDADPYDLLDALELADELSDGVWPTAAAALHAAWALTRPDEPLDDPRQVFAWLRNAGPERLREHGPALVEMALAAASLPVDLLRWLDDAVIGGRLEVDHETVRGRLLAAELAAALAGDPPPEQPLPPARLSVKAERDAESDLTSALLLGDADRMDLGQFDRVLRLACRHRIGLQPSPLRERLHGFAVAWIDTSGANWDPDGAALADNILDEAYDELHARFAEPLSPRLTETLSRFCDLFDDRDDLGDPLYCHLQAAEIARLKGEPGRLARLSMSLGKIARLPAGSPEAAEAALLFQRALIAWHADDTDVALAILDRLPSHVHPKIAERANSFLTAAQARPDTKLLDMLVSLSDNGWQPPSDTLRGLLGSQLAVRGFLAAAARDDIVTSDGLREAVGRICDVDPAVLELRATAVLEALLTTRNPHLTAAVLARYPTTRDGRGKPKPVQTLIRLAAERLSAGTDEEAADITVRLVVAMASQTLQRDQNKRWQRLVDLLRGYDRHLGAKDAKKWQADVRARFAPDSRELREWDDLFAAEPTRPGGKLQNILIRKTES